jgi:hypothetical protein
VKNPRIIATKQSCDWNDPQLLLIKKTLSLKSGLEPVCGTPQTNKRTSELLNT